MAKTKISEFSTTANNNSDINSINISEGCAPSGINDAIRELMRQLKEFQTGGAGDSVNSGGDFSVATNKFTVASASGNTSVAGTLGVTGAATLSSTLAVTGTTTLTGALVANGNATLGDASGDTVTIKGTPTLEVNPTLSGGTANGVLYLNGSKVATSGSALTFDGTTLGAPQVLLPNGNSYQIKSAGGVASAVLGMDASNNLYLGASGAVATNIFYTGGSEAMRLTSTGLGVGISSPSFKLQVASGASGATSAFTSTNATAYSATSYNGATARILLQGGAASGAANGIEFTQGGSSEIFFGQVQESGGAASFVWQGYNGSSYVERMRLDSSGNLGLGVTPSAWAASALDIGGWSSFAQRNTNGWTLVGGNVYWDGSNYRYKNSSTAALYELRGPTGVHAWFTAASGTADSTITFTQALTLDAGGNLLVGTTSTITSGKQTISFDGGTYNGLILSESANTASSTFLGFNNGSTTIGSVARVGSTSAVVYNTTSDYRLKTVTGNVTGQGERIDALKPVDYLWKEGGQQARGFLAHEFQTVYPNSVSGTKDAVDSDGNPVYQAMQASTAEVIADLVAEIQSLRARVASLES